MAGKLAKKQKKYLLYAGLGIGALALLALAVKAKGTTGTSGYCLKYDNADLMNGATWLSMERIHGQDPHNGGMVGLGKVIGPVQTTIYESFAKYGDYGNYSVWWGTGVMNQTQQVYAIWVIPKGSWTQENLNGYSGQASFYMSTTSNNADLIHC